MVSEKLIALGKITGVHGLGGNLKIYSYSRDIDSFGMGASVFITDKNGKENKFSILSAKAHKKGFLCSLEGIDHINVAEMYVGSEIFMRRSDLPELDEGTDYWVDLIGLDAFANQLLRKRKAEKDYFYPQREFLHAWLRHYGEYSTAQADACIDSLKAKERADFAARHPDLIPQTEHMDTSLSSDAHTDLSNNVIALDAYRKK